MLTWPQGKRCKKKERKPIIKKRKKNEKRIQREGKIKKDQGKCILGLCKKRNKREEDFKDPLNPHHSFLF
jgi:hypothetical protein